VLIGAPRAGIAAGFAVLEKSGRLLGTAHAGETAGAEDASTIYGNPAGMTLLDGTQLAASGFFILPSSTFHNEGSHLNPEVGGGLLRGGDGGDAGGLAVVPTFFLAHALNSRVHVGLGVFAPFGLTTRYDEWVGRYHTRSSSLFNVDFNPSVAVKLTDWLSIGGGADVQYAKAKLSNALDMGGICQIFGAEQGVTPQVCNALGLPPGQVDGYVRLRGSDWSVGYNLGVLYHPTPRTRVGLAYRSKIHHELDGTARFTVPKQAVILQTASGALRDTDAHAETDFPERVALGVSHELVRNWTVLGDIVWTRWSRFEELKFTFDNPSQPPITQPQDWDDSFRFALGVRWTPDPVWTLRLGTAYDQTPVPSATLRTPRIPDADRYWIAAGVGVRPFERLQLDIGYAHIFSPSVSIDNADPVTGHILRGEYDASAEVFGAQLTWNVGWPPF
jgi:long-chain fatty acid transport protein